MNGSQEMEEHKKATIQKNGRNPTQNNSLGESDMWENNFMHLDHRYNTLQKSLKSFQTNYCISLRNSGIYKQTDKQTI